jgi:hypothetical protein
MSQQMTFFGFYIDIFEFGFCLHTEQVVELSQDDPKTAQLRAAGFIGEDYDETTPKPNTLHNFIESTDEYKQVIGIVEPESLVYF